MAAGFISSLFIQSQRINSFDESFLVIQSYNKYNQIFFTFIQKKWISFNREPIFNLFLAPYFWR